MEISVEKTKVMVVSRSLTRSPDPEAAVFTCNGRVVEQVEIFKYLGLHFHSSGGVSHLIAPLKAKAAGSWTVVQQRHSQLQCGNTINLKLFLLQNILVPSLHYGCELWGMHTPCGVAQKARVALQSIYDRYLRHICRVKNGAKNFSGSIATCLQSVGQPMPLDRGSIPVLETCWLAKAESIGISLSLSLTATNSQKVLHTV
ncbi:TPA: hypothetical protein ACH3X3_011308 [Trebouxia sp. C0006]